MSRSAAPPNAGRAVPVPAIYYAVLGEIERHRQRFGIPMWKLDDAAGTQSRYYAKALYADTPSGRMATWVTLQNFIETLFPEGFSLTIKPTTTGCLSADKHRLAIRFSGARYDLEARQDWLAERQKNGGKKGGPARAAKLSARRRKAIAKRAANRRWIVKRGKEIEDALSPSASPKIIGHRENGNG